MRFSLKIRCPWSCWERIMPVKKRYLLNDTEDHSTGKFMDNTFSPIMFIRTFSSLSDLGMPLVKRLPRRWTTFSSSPATTEEFDPSPRPTLLSWWTSTSTSGRWVRWTRWARSTRWTATSDRAGRTKGWATTRRVWTSWLSTGHSWLKSGCRIRSSLMENSLSSTK